MNSHPGPRFNVNVFSSLATPLQTAQNTFTSYLFDVKLLEAFRRLLQTRQGGKALAYLQRTPWRPPACSWTEGLATSRTCPGSRSSGAWCRTRIRRTWHWRLKVKIGLASLFICGECWAVLDDENSLSSDLLFQLRLNMKVEFLIR